MTAFRNGTRSGVLFGIVTVFLVLIGFPGTIADIIATMLQNGSWPPIFGLSPDAFNLLLFLLFIGLWAGASGEKKAVADGASWKNALLGGAASGLLIGVILGCLSLFLGLLNQSGVKMNVYFAQLLPQAIGLFLIGLRPVQAAVFYFLFFIICGLAGGALRRAIPRGALARGIGSVYKRLSERIKTSGPMKTFKGKSTARILAYCLAAAIALLLPLGLGDYWNYTVGTIGIYVLLGLGLNIVVGMAGLLDLGYVAFFAIGGYTVALLTAPAHHMVWGFWTTIPIAIVLAAFAGIVLGVPVLRLRGDYLAIVTLGFGQIIAVMLRSDEMTGITGGPKGVSAVGGPSILGYALSSSAGFVYLILLAMVLVIIVTVRLRHSRIGRAWEAMREDETVARAMGINTWSYKLLAFAIGAAFAGLGGVIFASRNQFTGPEDYNLMVSISVLASVIVGGMGSIPGVAAGAFVLKGLPEVLRKLENYRVLAFGALLVIMMIIRPEGLIPTSRRKMEMNQGRIGKGAGKDSGGAKGGE